MLDLYFSPTPNGLKVRLALAEAGLPYRLVPVRLSAGEQFAPEFVALSPNSKIPVIVDHAPQDGVGPVPVFESGAILLYLAQKSGRLLPTAQREQLEALQWLFWQVSALGPMAVILCTRARDSGAPLPGQWAKTGQRRARRRRAPHGVSSQPSCGRPTWLKFFAPITLRAAHSR